MKGDGKDLFYKRLNLDKQTMALIRKFRDIKDKMMNDSEKTTWNFDEEEEGGK